MEKLEQILCESWSCSCLPIDYRNCLLSGVWDKVALQEVNDAQRKKNYEWENSLISLGCGFIRDAKTTNHLGWATKPNVPVGFVLAKHPKQFFIDNNNCDFCLIPKDFALKIMALEYLPA